MSGFITGIAVTAVAVFLYKKWRERREKTSGTGAGGRPGPKDGETKQEF